MRKLFYLLVVVLSTSFVNAQIEIQTKVDSEIILPKIDSTKDLYDYKTAEQFLGLVGKKIYAYPLNPNSYKYSSFGIKYFPKEKFKHKDRVFKAGESVGLDTELYNELVADKYFLVEDVLFGRSFNRLTPEEWAKKYKFSSFSFNVELQVKDLMNNRIFTVSTEEFERFVPEFYFKYLQNKYVNANVLVGDYSSFKIEENPISAPKKYTEKNIFTVAKIEIVQSNSEHSVLPEITAVLQNEKETKNVVINGRRSKFNDYPLKSDYDKYLKRYADAEAEKDKLYREKFEREMAEYQKIQDEKDAIKLKSLIKKYGSNIANKLIKEEVWIGMTREMLIDSRGLPTRTSSLETKDVYQVQYVYETRFFGTDYILVENGKVKLIQSY